MRLLFKLSPLYSKSTFILVFRRPYIVRGVSTYQDVCVCVCESVRITFREVWWETKRINVLNRGRLLHRFTIFFLYAYHCLLLPLHTAMLVQRKRWYATFKRKLAEGEMSWVFALVSLLILLILLHYHNMILHPNYCVCITNVPITHKITQYQTH